MAKVKQKLFHPQNIRPEIAMGLNNIKTKRRIAY